MVAIINNASALLPPGQCGLVIVKVFDQSPAKEMGLSGDGDDVIIAVNGSTFVYTFSLLNSFLFISNSLQLLCCWFSFLL
jgi:S1-C subfamily serine protease